MSQSSITWTAFCSIYSTKFVTPIVSNLFVLMFYEAELIM